MDLPGTFLAARDRIYEHGWGRGRAQDHQTGHLCLRGSVMAALGMLGVRVLSLDEQERLVIAFDALDSYCRDHFDGEGTIPVNDYRVANKEEAIDVLEGAAKWAAERQRS